MFSHSCLKCGTPYQDQDPDPYYCAKCIEERKAIAKKVDAQMKMRQSRRPTVSNLQAYNAEARFFKSPDGREISFTKVKL